MFYKLIEKKRNEWLNSNECTDALDKFWEGSILDTKYGMMPVYLPNLTDSTTRLLKGQQQALQEKQILKALRDQRRRLGDHRMAQLCY